MESGEIDQEPNTAELLEEIFQRTADLIADNKRSEFGKVDALVHLQYAFVQVFVGLGLDMKKLRELAIEKLKSID